MKKSIAIVHLINWQGLYINGKLVTEGERIGITDLAEALKLDMHYHYPDGLPLSKAKKYYNDHKCMPEKLTDTFGGLVNG
jgi:hypothetical protein